MPVNALPVILKAVLYQKTIKAFIFHIAFILCYKMQIKERKKKY